MNGANKPDFPDAVYQPAMAANVKEQKTNDQVFKNLRGQAYGSLRDRVYKTFRAIVHGEFYDPEELISFSSEMSCITKTVAISNSFDDSTRSKCRWFSS